jgi:twitching motility protein PilT
MQTGQDKYGMQTFNQSLAMLYFKKQITLELAISRSSNPDELQDLINRGPVSVMGAPIGQQGQAPGRPPLHNPSGRPVAPLGRVGK